MDTVIANLGYLTLLYLFYKISRFILRLLYRHLLAHPADPRSFGQWAVITGATDGIGKAYALALSKAGMDVVLIGRNQAKLDMVASEIEGLYRVRTKTVVVDFADDDKVYSPKLEKELSGLEVGVLVNNVGMYFKYPAEFLAIEDEGETTRSFINVNITSINAMTKLVLPRMLARKEGAIINISSIVSVISAPLFSVYAATKAYVLKLSEALDIEYAPRGIIVQCVTPGVVTTKMVRLEKSSFFEPSPEVFVASALGRLGVESVTYGYWTHDLMAAFWHVLPKAVEVRLSLVVSRMVEKRMAAEYCRNKQIS